MKTFIIDDYAKKIAVEKDKILNAVTTRGPFFNSLSFTKLHDEKKKIHDENALLFLMLKLKLYVYIFIIYVYYCTLLFHK